jgi:hypothetical protein
MAKSDFIPRSDAEFLLWHDHFIATAIANQAESGLGDAELAAHQADNAEFRAKLAAKNLADATAKKVSAEKTDSRSRIEGNVRASARRIKAGAGYSEPLGHAFRIVGAEDSTDLSQAKPTLNATDKGAGQVVLDFVKSKSDGINVYGKREGEADFVFLARDTASPYVDSRPLAAPGKAEVRRYVAVFVLADEEVGLRSDEVVVTCSP